MQLEPLPSSSLPVFKTGHLEDAKMNNDFDPYVKLDKLKSYYTKPRAKKAAKNSVLKSKYGIDLNEYNKMLKKQNHKCDICGVDEVDVKNGLYVDHCHTSNAVRSLLCVTCNAGLGMFKDSEELLIKAIMYLRKHEKAV